MQTSARHARAPLLLGACVATSLACSYDLYGFGTDPYEPPACGNGKLEGLEQCDPGPGGPDAAQCTPECTLAICGDGTVEADEQCDLGTGNADDGECTTGCRSAACGDGLVAKTEECDDGNAVDDDACTNACKTTFCGDGVIQGEEECDDGENKDGNDNGVDRPCTPFCKEARCGDGYTWFAGGEECDDDNLDNTDDCTTLCKQALCGDGFVWEGIELCDDGNAVDDDACGNDCTSSQCGDGMPDLGEECDDGNMENLDGCRNTCVTPKCGDTIVDMELGEECDEVETADTGVVCRGCKWYLKKTWYFPTQSIPARDIPDDIVFQDVNLPTLDDCGFFTFDFAALDLPDNAEYGFLHEIEFDLGLDHPAVGELVIHLIIFNQNPSRYPLMRRPGLNEGNVCSQLDGGSDADLSSNHRLAFAAPRPCDPMDPDDPDCAVPIAEDIGEGLDAADVVCAGGGMEPTICPYFFHAGQLEDNPIDWDKLKGFDLKPGPNWGTPKMHIVVQDTVDNGSGGRFETAVVRTWRRKTAQ